MERKDELKRMMEKYGVNVESIDLWHVFTRVFKDGRKAIKNEMEKLGLKPIELRVLFTLSQKSPCTMNYLSSENAVTGAWITGIVDDLENSGYITKDRSSVDRRIINVSITESGNEALLRGVKVYTELIETALSNLQPEEIKQFKETLQKIEDALNESR